MIHRLRANNECVLNIPFNLSRQRQQERGAAFDPKVRVPVASLEIHEHHERRTLARTRAHSAGTRARGLARAPSAAARASPCALGRGTRELRARAPCAFSSRRFLAIDETIVGRQIARDLDLQFLDGGCIAGFAYDVQRILEDHEIS